MEKRRYETLYDTLNSHVMFGAYLTSFGLCDVDLTQISFSNLITVYVGHYLTTSLDKYIVKDIPKNHLNLMPEFIEDLALIVSRKTKDNKYKLGEMKFDNAEDVIIKLRNKLAHGDFDIVDDNIVFIEDGKAGFVDIYSLSKLVPELDTRLDEADMITPKSSNLIYTKFNVNKKIHGDPSFKKFCKDLKIVTVKDEPVEGKKRTPKYNELVKTFKTGLYELLNDKGVDDYKIKSYTDYYKGVLDLYNVKLDVEINTAYDEKTYSVLLDFYKENKDYVERLDGNDLCHIISNKYLKISKGKFQTFNYRKGLYVGIVMMHILKNNPGLTFAQACTSSGTLASIISYDLENMIISSYLSCFYSCYQYGLEDGLTQKGEYDFAKIVNKESFDFSLLDLDALYDEKMVIEHDFKDYKTDYIKYETKAKDANIKLEKSLEVLQNYIENCPEEKKKPEIMFKYQSNYFNNLEDVNEKEAFAKLIKERTESFDLDKYVRNINIIEHIRNAIAHGTIYVDEYNNSDDYMSKKMIIEDVYDGKVTYHKELTLKEFTSVIRPSIHVNDYYIEKLSDENPKTLKFKLE